MEKEWNAVEILRHSRHDWLNKLQLIKGNLALERLDRVNEIIEEIIMDSKNESKLTNLKAPQLAELLMLFNWEEQHFFLEFEVIGDEQNLSNFDKDITTWCCAFFNKISNVIKPFAENHLILSIQLSEKEIRFIFDFRGIIEDKSKMLTYLEEQKKDAFIQLVEYEVHNEEMVVVTQISL